MSIESCRSITKTFSLGFGAVEASHHVFAAFVPKFTFSGKRVIDYNVTAFDPTRHVKSWRTAWENADEGSGPTRVPVPRSAALRYYPGSGKRRVRLNDYGDCRSRQSPNVGALRSRPLGSQTKCHGSSRCEESTKTAGYDTTHDTNVVTVGTRPV